MLPSKYPTQREELLFSGFSITMDIISDVDFLFNELVKKDDNHPDVQDERIPYWADLWPSAIGLSHFLIQSAIIKPGMNVLEIGCGLGLPGIVAGKLGGDVVLTDYMQEPLVFAEHNWKLNNTAKAAFKILDWRKSDSAFAAVLVLAADVAYETKAFADLMLAFRVLVKPGGCLLMAEPNRAFAQTFFSELKKQKFEIHSTAMNVIRHQLKTKVNLYTIRPQ